MVARLIELEKIRGHKKKKKIVGLNCKFKGQPVEIREDGPMYMCRKQ